MTIALESLSTFQSGSTATKTGHMDLTGTPSRQLLLALIGVEGVAVGSGPWVIYDSNNAHPDGEGDLGPGGWVRVGYIEPSATGNGLDIWAALWGAGTFSHFKFGSSQTFASRILVYNGIYDPGSSVVGTGSLSVVTAGIVRALTSAQVTGNNPACPSVFSFVNEMVIAVASDQMQSPGFGTPTPAGWVSAFDSKRASTFGNVEITAADLITTIEGDTGSIPLSATATATSTKGVTGTLAIRPATSGGDVTPGATSPLIIAEYARAS